MRTRRFRATRHGGLSLRFMMTDEELNAARSEPKRKTSATRPKLKGKHWERQFDCLGETDRRYRIFMRWNAELKAVFSVGLALLRDGQPDLVLCRYNGAYHTHRNRLDNTPLDVGFHVHTARADYIAAGMDPDGHATATDRYTNVDQALRSLLADCNIRGIAPDGDTFTANLFD